MGSRDEADTDLQQHVRCPYGPRPFHQLVTVMTRDAAALKNS